MNKNFIETTIDGKKEIVEGNEPLKKPNSFPLEAAQSNYQDAQNEEDNKKKIKKTDKIKGGLADNSEAKDFDEDQLKMGIKIEMEHTNDPKIAKEIAMDHLKEHPKYYTHLNEMERKIEKSTLKNKW